MLGIIGGTGLTNYQGLKIIQHESIDTPYGETSSLLTKARLNDVDITFIARHGAEHQIPPHKVNYRANIWALKQVKCKEIIAVNAVGGITDKTEPGSIIIPDQIIDYSYGRKNTFFEDNLDSVTHIDFTHPYTLTLVDKLAAAAKNIGLAITKGGTYACTQGPRLETAAEIQKLKNDGCDIVGMTAMPEASLAREMEIDYASICLSANWAAGISLEILTMKAIEEEVNRAIEKVKILIEEFLSLKSGNS